MPVALSYPGVYTQEAPSGVHTIVGVATSIAAFIGRAIKGAVNKPITINSYADFERTFGGLWLNSTLGFAVRDFFLNGGTQAVIVRLYDPYFPTRAERDAAASYGRAIITAVTAVTAMPGAGFQTAIDTAVATAVATPPLAGQTAAVQQSVNAIVAAVHAAAGVAGAKVTDVVAAATTAAALYAPITKSTVAIKTLNGMVAGPDLILEAKYEGAYTAGIVVKVSIPDGDIINSVVALYGLTSSDWFNIQITNSDGTTEQYNNVSVKDSARRLDRILANESRLLRVADATPLPLTTALDTGNSPYSVVSGNAGVDGNDLVPADVLGNQSTKTGIYALENADLFNLLCIPPTTAGAALDTSIIDAATTYCQSRRAMMIIDPPWSTVASAVSGTPAPSGIGAVSTNAAVFFPSLLQPNPLRGNLVEQFAPCGAVAGVMARIDASRGVWKAPAGLEAALVGVPQLSVAIGDQESGQLNQIGVNALRTLPAAGNVMWGARTRVGADRLASQWKYIPVRRLALHIEESLYRGTQWAVFQPNAEPLWAQLRLNIGTFMQDLFRQGAFQGQTPRDAYFVKCDSSTTTQSDIDQGVVNVVVGFAPLLPAEFVIITLRQIAGQSPT